MCVYIYVKPFCKCGNGWGWMGRQIMCDSVPIHCMFSEKCDLETNIMPLLYLCVFLNLVNGFWVSNEPNPDYFAPPSTHIVNE